LEAVLGVSWTMVAGFGAFVGVRGREGRRVAAAVVAAAVAGDGGRGRGVRVAAGKVDGGDGGGG